ncbi:MAG TPA: hypothetical protein G4N96_02150 [Chloroflexi bacterium]|nr:hypothetical protein [Chloroflexota bacterium]
MARSEPRSDSEVAFYGGTLLRYAPNYKPIFIGNVSPDEWIQALRIRKAAIL